MFLPYALAMLLGRTFNYNTLQSGIDIFPAGEVDSKTKTIPAYFTNSKFKIIKSKRDVQDLLDVNGELSLKVMAGKFNLDGSGSYLKSNQDGQHVIEVLCRQTYETVTKTLTSDIVPAPSWQAFPANSLGTHFVRSITYGGELIASLKYTASNKNDLEKIDAALSAGIGLEGTLDLQVGGTFQKVQSELSESSSLTVEYYATTPVDNIPRTIEGLQQLISGFQDRVAEVNNGLGNPIRMELVDLSVLTKGSSVLSFVKNAAVTSQFDDIIAKFDDIRSAKYSMNDWLRGTHFSHDELVKISNLNSKIIDVNQKFIEVISTMDIGAGASSDQFDAAITAYKGVENFDLPGKYLRLYLQLRDEIEALQRAGCLSREIRNKHLLADNVFDSVNTQLQAGVTSVSECKTICTESLQCKSVTFITRIAGIPATDSRCYMNLVPINDGNTLPVPAAGAEGYNVLFFDRDPKYCIRRK